MNHFFKITKDKMIGALIAVISIMIYLHFNRRENFYAGSQEFNVEDLLGELYDGNRIIISDGRIYGVDENEDIIWHKGAETLLDSLSEVTPERVR